MCTRSIEDGFNGHRPYCDSTMRVKRERQKVNFNFWSDLHLIGSQAVIKIYVIIKIYWPRSMCSQFNSIWILLLCVVLSHNHHKLSIRCPELQKRLLLLLLLCCVHRFSSCSSKSNRSLPKCFFLLRVYQILFMTSLEFIPFWYLVCDKRWWWISYFVQRRQHHFYLVFSVSPHHNSLFLFTSMVRWGICHVVIDICFKEIIKMIWYHRIELPSAAIVARIRSIWNTIFFSIDPFDSSLLLVLSFSKCSSCR